jgi:hypothetical protein
MPLVRIEAEHLLARGAVAAAAAGDPSAAGHADRIARSLRRRPLPIAAPMADLIRAALAHLRADRSGAVALCDAAATAFERLDMGLFAAAARMRSGLLASDAAHHARASAALAWMRAQGVASPERIADLLAPGFTARSSFAAR